MAIIGDFVDEPRRVVRLEVPPAIRREEVVELHDRREQTGIRDAIEKVNEWLAKFYAPGESITIPACFVGSRGKVRTFVIDHFRKVGWQATLVSPLGVGDYVDYVEFR